MVAFTPQEVIKRHRLNLMIHSFLYYWYDDPVWTDDKWQQVADELVALQMAYPEPIGFYDEAFSDWTGATGMHLPKDDYITGKAIYVFRLNQSMKGKG